MMAGVLCRYVLMSRDPWRRRLERDDVRQRGREWARRGAKLQTSMPSRKATWEKVGAATRRGCCVRDHEEGRGKEEEKNREGIERERGEGRNRRECISGVQTVKGQYEIRQLCLVVVGSICIGKRRFLFEGGVYCKELQVTSRYKCRVHLAFVYFGCSHGATETWRLRNQFLCFPWCTNWSINKRPRALVLNWDQLQHSNIGPTSIVSISRLKKWSSEPCACSLNTRLRASPGNLVLSRNLIVLTLRGPSEP